MDDDNIPSYTPGVTPGMGPHGPTGSPGFGAPMDSGGLDPDILENGGLVGKAGEPLPEGTTVGSKEAIVDALKTVYDPEIPVDIYELGLIYELDVAPQGNIKIEMTLTAPGCPVAGILPQQVADAAASVDGTGEVEVFLVWEPAWDMDKMSEDAKLALGFF
jgi:FeS assembly SUF system protein